MSLVDVALQAVGFIVQTIPIAVLLFLPFGEERFRLGMRKSISLVMIVLLVDAVVFAGVNAFSYDGKEKRLLMDGMMSAAIVLGALMYFYMIEAENYVKGIVVIICIHYASILYFLGNFSLRTLRELGIAREAVHEMPYGIEYIFISFGLLLITYPFLCRLMVRHVRKTLVHMEGMMLKRETGNVFVCFAVYIIGCVCLSFMKSNLQFLFASISLSFISILVYYMFFCEINMMQERNHMKEQLLLYGMEYRRITESIEAARRMRHDIRQHLNIISVLNGQGKSEELAEYLKKYNAVYEKQSTCIYTEEPTVNGILAYYVSLCEEKNVNLDMEIRLGTSSISNPVDMTVVLGNCLENALTALDRLPDKERQMRIRMGMNGAALLISIENRCAKIPGANNGEFGNWTNFYQARTSPAGGIGLRSVSDVAEKYGGMAQFRCKDGWFSSRIMMKDSVNSG